MRKIIVGYHFTAIDIGTTKICVLIAKINQNGKIDVLGIGKHPSFGLKKGVVVNIGMTVDSIRKAVRQAEEMSGLKVESAIVGISGGHIRSVNSNGVVAIKGKDVSQLDIDKVVEAAKAIPIPEDQEVLHVLPQYFKVDGQEQVFDSLGMYGVRLEAQVHIITGAVASAQNIIKSCELAGVKVSDIILEQLASADAVLTESEREIGVGIIDIGGGTSDFAIYRNGRIIHSKVLPLAGDHFTNDLAVAFGISKNQAEQLKKIYGAVDKKHEREFGNNILDIDLGYDGGIKSVCVSDIIDVLNFRAEEIFELFNDEITEFNLRNFVMSGIVLTGGGSLLSGIKNIAAEKLNLSVRLGCPISDLKSVSGIIPDVLKSPIYSTAYGLLVYVVNNEEGTFNNPNSFGLNKIFKRMQSWLYDFL
jgi:cell division protein FtsA